MTSAMGDGGSRVPRLFSKKQFSIPLDNLQNHAASHQTLSSCVLVADMAFRRGREDLGTAHSIGRSSH